MSRDSAFTVKFNSIHSQHVPLHFLVSVHYSLSKIGRKKNMKIAPMERCDLTMATLHCEKKLYEKKSKQQWVVGRSIFFRLAFFSSQIFSLRFLNSSTKRAFFSVNKMLKKIKQTQNHHNAHTPTNIVEC